jgi:hypothetical protein
MAPAPAPMILATGPPQRGQERSGSSDMLWNRSKRCPHSRQRYSYVGTGSSFGKDCLRVLPILPDLPAGFQLSNALLDRLQALPYVCRLLFKHRQFLLGRLGG